MNRTRYLQCLPGCRRLGAGDVSVGVQRGGGLFSWTPRYTGQVAQYHLHLVYHISLLWRDMLMSLSRKGLYILDDDRSNLALPKACFDEETGAGAETPECSSASRIYIRNEEAEDGLCGFLGNLSTRKPRRFVCWR